MCKKKCWSPGDHPEEPGRRRERLTAAANHLSESVGTAPACQALGVPRSSLYRQRRPRLKLTSRPRPRPERALSAAEREAVLDILHSERFRDQTPAEVQAALLDEGTYLCSVRTMYRILDGQNEVRERRDQLMSPNYAQPELLATAPNQAWSWDVTKLLGPAKWTYFYVILDIFSRHVVGWMVATHESATLAGRLIHESCVKQNINQGQLKIHADRGPSMTSRLVAQLLADLGVTKTHSRPYVSNDNPYSESQFKTLKYRPSFPDRFGSIQDARAFCQEFFRWYNLRTPSFWNRHADAGNRSLWPRPGGDRCPPPGAYGCLCGPPGAICPPTAPTGALAGSRLDQSARTGTGEEGKTTVNFSSKCLKMLDTFR